MKARKERRRMRMKQRCIALLMALLMLAPCVSAFAADDGFHTSYTYNYDYWGDVRESPDAYTVETMIYSSTLGLEVTMKKPQSLYIRNQDIYVCDTGNNRLLQIHRDGTEYTLTRIIDSVNGVEPATFNSPSDVFVDEAENIYVADTNNNRVVMMDKDLNFLKVFTRPEDATFSADSGFLPSKIVVDVAGRLYVLATNVNKGLIKYESDTTFTGYIGANKVSYNIAEYIWKMYFTTKEQRAQQESYVPTEYENIYMDSDGFIYATNTVFSEYDLKSDSAKPIRRLNGVGDDILIKNDKYPPIGDLDWTEGSTDYGPSKFADITVLDNDIYVAFDRTRGRIFGYDAQGIMLWAFGTKGNTEGAFITPAAIDHMGNDLFCLDSSENSITVFIPTEYGELIYAANSDYLKGDYFTSAEKWEQVLQLNANYNLAFIGIGRALLRQGSYKEAMDYFEMAHDRTNYGRAFRYYRKEWVEQNILWIVIPLACLLIIPLIVKQGKKMRGEVEMYERQKVHH